ncbi:MAG: hypothetical protein QM763_01745 [Agriterribacter sp.]
MKQYAFLALLICVAIISSAQNKKDVVFSAEFKKGSVDSIIILNVKNASSKTYYYFISAAGLTDTGWVSLISDINSLGQNGFIALKPLKPKNTVVKCISKKKILFIYAYYKPQKIRFSLMYYNKRDFEAEGKIIDLPPL